MVKFFVWCEIVCRECSHTATGQFTLGALPRTALKEQAMNEGFLFKHGETFCRRACLDAFEAAQPIEREGGE